MNEEAILQTIQAYTDCLSHDPTGAARYCDQPLIVIGAAEPLVFASRAEIEALYAELVSSLKARGYSHSRWMELHVRQLTASTALVSGMGIRYTTEGGELERIGATYLLRKADEAWKITTLTLHDPGAVIRLS